MANKICKKCSSSHIKKDGKMRGKQRYKCCLCGYVFQNSSRYHINKGLWEDYTEHKQTYKELGEKYGYNTSWVRSTIGQGICLVIAGLLFKSWIALAIIYFLFSIFDGFVSPSWNHCLISLTKGKTIATSRSIVFGCVSLYATFLKWIMSYLSPNLALIILGVIILVTNTILAKNMLNSKNE